MRRKMVQSSDQSGDVLPSMPPEQFRVELHRQGDQPIGLRAAWTSEQEGLVIYDVREDAWLEDGWSFFLFASFFGGPRMRWNRNLNLRVSIFSKILITKFTQMCDISGLIEVFFLL